MKKTETAEQKAAETLETFKPHISDVVRAVELDTDVKIAIQHVNFYYGSTQALFDVTLPIREMQVTALIGPSG